MVIRREQATVQQECCCRSAGREQPAITVEHEKESSTCCHAISLNLSEKHVSTRSLLKLLPHDMAAACKT